MVDDPYGLNSIFQQLERDRKALPDAVKERIRRDMAGTADHLLHHAGPDARRAYLAQPLANSNGRASKFDIIADYAQRLTDHHEQHGNLDGFALEDGKHLENLFTGKKTLTPETPTPHPSRRSIIPEGTSAPVTPPVAHAEPVQARLDWMRDELAHVGGSRPIASVPMRKHISGALEPAIIQHVNDTGEILSEQRVRDTVRKLHKLPPEELANLSPDQIIKDYLQPSKPAARPAVAPKPPKAAVKMVNAAHHEIEVRAAERMGVSHAEYLANHAATDTHALTAKKHVSDAVQEHYKPNKFGNREAPHISEQSVRSAAASHYEAVHTGTLGKSIPESKLWDNIHDAHAQPTPAQIQQEKARLTRRERAAIAEKAAGLDPAKHRAFMQRESQLATLIPDAAEREAFIALENKVAGDAHIHFSNLSPLQQQARLEYLTHAQACPHLSEYVATCHEVEKPGLLSRLFSRSRDPQRLTVNGIDLLLHQDGTVTRQIGDKVQVIQSGWKNTEAVVERMEREIASTAARAAPAVEQAAVRGESMLSRAASGVRGGLGTVAALGGAAIGLGLVAGMLRSPAPKRIVPNDVADDLEFKANPSVNLGVRAAPGQYQQNWTAVSGAEPSGAALTR